MQSVHKKRLLKLAAYLDDLPAEQFDMREWCKESGCGTVVCALGHACSLPAFQRLGLRLIRDVIHPTLGGLRSIPVILDKNGLLRTGFDAGAEVFELSGSEAVRLFSPAYYRPGVTPQEVAERIWAFVREKEKAAA